MPAPIKPGTGRYVYVLAHESWYAETGMAVSLGVMHLETGACVWEFTVEPLHSEALRVEVTDRNWSAFAAVPEVFAALATLIDTPDGQRISLSVNEVRDLLDEFGFEDITPRVGGGDDPVPTAWSPGDLQQFVDEIERTDP
jgi:hypothetical protein